MASKERASNKDILNAIRNDASAEYQMKIPEVKSMDDMDSIIQTIAEQPNVKNEFISAINNKVFKAVVMNKLWENPYQMLKKGELPYGQGIEQIFVDLATKKNFDENFGSGGTNDAARSLLSKELPTILDKFVQKNFAYKYKVSLSNQRLRTAFMSEYGVSDLINGLVTSVMTTANFEEFKDMLDLLKRQDQVPASSTLGTGAKEVGLLERVAKLTQDASGKTKQMFVKLTGNGDHLDVQELAIKVREYVAEFGFLSKKYNLAQVTTACNPEDLVLFTTPEVVAHLDVTQLAMAFNVSLADLNVRVIKVPKDTFAKMTSRGAWGTGSTINVLPVAILADKELIQQYDTLIDSGSFYNPDTLMTNLFLHRQGITALCEYAQAVVFGYQTA